MSTGKGKGEGEEIPGSSRYKPPHAKESKKKQARMPPKQGAASILPSRPAGTDLGRVSTHPILSLGLTPVAISSSSSKHSKDLKSGPRKLDHRATKPRLPPLAIPESGRSVDPPEAAPEPEPANSEPRGPFDMEAVMIETKPESKSKSLPASAASPEGSQASKAHSEFAEPIESFRLVYSMGGKINEKNLVKRNKIHVDEDYMAGANAAIVEGKWRVLMIYPGQGGTFGYGDKFLSENDKWLVIKDPDKEKNLDPRERIERRHRKAVEYSKTYITKHITYYRPGVELIGTKDISTCVGVYFEIEGNRVFCAHINAFHDLDRSSKVPRLEKGTVEAKEIKRAVIQRLEEHSIRYGWNWKDVKWRTVYMMCPWWKRCGWVVADAINEFLRMPEHTGLRIPKDVAGLVQFPGKVDSDRSRVFMFKRTIKLENGRYRDEYDETPDEIHEVLYEPDYVGQFYDNYEIGRWEYTYGRGWKIRKPAPTQRTELGGFFALKPWPK